LGDPGAHRLGFDLGANNGADCCDKGLAQGGDRSATNNRNFEGGNQFFCASGRPAAQVTVDFIDGYRHRFPVVVMCRLLESSQRTYYAAKVRRACARVIADEVHKVMIKGEWTAIYSCYGARRLHKQLNRKRYQIVRCTVVQLLKILNIRGVRRAKKVFTTHPDMTAVRSPDLVKRDFTAVAPNQLWLADITYCSTWEGRLYVSFTLDVFSRMIVGWQIAPQMRTDLVLDALEMATWQRQVANGCTHHSDSGSQYTSLRYTDRLDIVGLAASIGTIGD